MKKISYLVSLACAFLFAACSSDNDEIAEVTQNTEKQNITIGVNLPGSDDSRVMFGNTLSDLLWMQGDKLQVYTMFNQENKVPLNSELTTDISEPSKSASFSGEINKGDTYKVVYLWESSNLASGGPAYYPETDVYDCQLLGQKQPAFNFINDICNHMIMVGEKDYTLDELKNGITLKHVVSIFEVNLKDIPENLSTGANYYRISLLAKNPAGAEVKQAMVKVENKQNGPSTDKKVYIVFDPAKIQVKQGDNIKLSFESLDASGNVLKTRTATAQWTRNTPYVAGKYYTLTVSNNKPGLVWDPEETGGDTPGTDIPAGYTVIYDKVFNSAEAVNAAGFSTFINTRPSIDVIHSFSEGALLIKPQYADMYYLATPDIQMLGSFSYSSGKKGDNKMEITYHLKNFDAATIKNAVGISYLTTNSTKWSKVSGFKPEVNKDVTATIDLPGGVFGKNLKFAFKYNSNVTIDGQWLIKSIKIYGKE